MLDSNFNLSSRTPKTSDIVLFLQNLINNLDGIVGDVPVAEQLSIALNHMATKEHKHEEYASREEVEELKREVERLTNLIGDISVSEQISKAIKTIK